MKRATPGSMCPLPPWMLLPSNALACAEAEGRLSAFIEPLPVTAQPPLTTANESTSQARTSMAAFTGPPTSISLPVRDWTDACTLEQSGMMMESLLSPVTEGCRSPLLDNLLDADQEHCESGSDPFDVSETLPVDNSNRSLRFIDEPRTLAMAPEPECPTETKKEEDFLPTQCRTCGKTYTVVSNLTKHIRAVHMKLRPFKCKLCPFSSAERNKLAMHARSVHEGRRPFACLKCGATFSQASDRKRHTLVRHEGHRPYSCTVCTKSFGRRSSLTQHVARVHKDTANFRNSGPGHPGVTA